MIVNTTGFAQQLEPGLEFGQATRADVIDEEHYALTEPVDSEFGKLNVALVTEMRTVPAGDDPNSKSKRLEVILEPQE